MKISAGKNKTKTKQNRRHDHCREEQLKIITIEMFEENTKCSKKRENQKRRHYGKVWSNRRFILHQEILVQIVWPSCMTTASITEKTFMLRVVGNRGRDRPRKEQREEITETLNILLCEADGQSPLSRRGKIGQKLYVLLPST